MASTEGGQLLTGANGPKVGRKGKVPEVSVLKISLWEYQEIIAFTMVFLHWRNGIIYALALKINWISIQNGRYHDERDKKQTSWMWDTPQDSSVVEGSKMRTR